MMSHNIKNKTYIIAEAGINHNGSLSIAKKLIKTAKDCGADAIKFQTYKSNLLATPTAKKSEYQNEYNKEISQLKMLKKYELSKQDHEKLLEYSKKLKIDFISTPFDIDSLQYLVSKLKLKTIKISSTDITNIPFLLEAGSKSTNIIISSGMSSIDDVKVALSSLSYANKYKDSKQKYKFNTLRHKNFYTRDHSHKYLSSKVILMHCTTAYPAPLNELNLNVIETYRNIFNISIGYSDHSSDTLTPIIAVAKGVSTIETHITLDKKMLGPDHKASLNPSEFKKYVNNIRESETMLGNHIKTITKSEKKNISSARKSLVISNNIIKNDKITTDNLGIRRPGTGMHPIEFYKVIGKKVNKSLKANHILKRSDIK